MRCGKLHHILINYEPKEGFESKESFEQNCDRLIGKNSNDLLGNSGINELFDNISFQLRSLFLDNG